MSWKMHAQRTIILVILCVGWNHATQPGEPKLSSAEYRGWSTQCLSNGLVELHVVPEIGGRIVQFRVGEKEFLWVNPQLAGKLPTESGLSPDGGWLNYGGDKLWPAPQGWDTSEQWPGPPDAVLDGQPYACEAIKDEGQLAIRLTSREDPRSGIQFSRVIRLVGNGTRVDVEATMKNIDDRPRRWGIWAHTQLDATADVPERPNRLMRAWCPVNRSSRFIDGYDVIFGRPENPSFRTDWRRGLVAVDYRYEVGKIGVDSTAGWSATVDGRNGTVFVQRFDVELNRPYPDNASVEFWHNGVGKIHAYRRDIELPDDPAENPYVFESEMLSPFHELRAGESSSWNYQWFAANIGGDYPVVDCNEVGIVAEPLRIAIQERGEARSIEVTGRFGVFAPCNAWLRSVDKNGAEFQRVDLDDDVSPLDPLVVSTKLPYSANVATVDLLVTADGTSAPIPLARADMPTATVPGQWSTEKAWKWYDRQPWLIGCNYLPSTAVNNIEMWQADTFDPETTDRELGWAHKLGFNTVRVFLNYVVWKDDPEGLKSRFAEFLTIANRHQISVMPILFDDCNFANRVAKAGRQPDPIPGVHNSQWVSSPPLAMVTLRNAWPNLESYVKDILETFARDPRIVIWDLYNEPGNSNMRERSLPLVEAVFTWAREAKPQQPLTIAPWTDFDSRMSRRMMELSDVISFHGYDQLPGVQRKMEICRKYDRPILCTEWLHRQSGNTVESILPTFQARRTGCYSWGLVYGRTQTFMPWGSKPGDPEPALWQHDLFQANGKPYRAEELQIIRDLKSKAAKKHANR